MSRIGNKIIQIPEGVEVNIDDNNFAVVKGPKGQLENQFTDRVSFNREGNEITVSRKSDHRTDRALHGTTRSILSNMIVGVHEEFVKELAISGVGYRATLKGNILSLTLGKSHLDELDIPAGLTVEVPKNTQVIIKGFDKQLVGEFAAKVRELRRPEPYKGKGIRYKDERVIIKEGKTAKK